MATHSPARICHGKLGSSVSSIERVAFGELPADHRRLIGAIVVTIPSAWFVWPDKSHADSAHHGSHDEHAEEHEEKEGGEAPEEEAPQEEAPQEGQEKQDEQAEEVQAEQKEESEPKPESDSTQEEDKSKDSEETGKKASGSGGEGQSTGPDANKLSGKDEKTEEKPTPENYGNTDNGAQFKGKVKDESPGKTEENRKREDDAKGGFKKRIDSGLGKNLGQGPEYDEPEGVSPRTEAVRDRNQLLSNVRREHSTNASVTVCYFQATTKGQAGRDKRQAVRLV